MKCALGQYETFNLIGNWTFDLGHTKPPNTYFNEVLQCCGIAPHVQNTLYHSVLSNIFFQAEVSGVFSITVLLPSSSVGPGSYPFWLINEEISAYCADSNSLGEKQNKTNQQNKPKNHNQTHKRLKHHKLLKNFSYIDVKIGAQYTLKQYIHTVGNFHAVSRCTLARSPRAGERLVVG